jgi:hypothetical protein
MALLDSTPGQGRITLPITQRQVIWLSDFSTDFTKSLWLKINILLAPSL